MGELDLVAIEQAITDNTFQAITGSHSSAKLKVIELPSGKIFHKRYVPRVFTAEEIEKRAEFNRMVYSLAGPSYINKVSLEEEVAKEVKTLRLWDAAGIPVPKILHYDGACTIIMEYLEGHSSTDDLVKAHNPDMFARVLDTHHRIRCEAKNRNDKDYLHSDPYPDNFFFDTKNERILPIDPSKVVNAKLTVAEADARMNLLFMAKLFLLPIPGENTKAYVNQFAERLTREEKTLMSELNFDAAAHRAYFATQNLPKGNILDIYFRTDVRDVIQAALTK